MKFTKDQAIKELEAKVPTKDKELDLARTISEAVDNSLELIGEDSEMELSDFVEKVFKQVKTSIGLTHSENSKVATKMQEQIDALKQQVEGKEPPKPNDPKPTDPALQELLDWKRKMEEKQEKSDTEKAIADKREKLISKMGESIKDKDWINAYLSEISITADMDVEQKAKDYIAFYNKTQSGGGKYTPKPAGDDDIESSYVKTTVAAAAKIKKNMGGGPVSSTTVNNNNNN